MLPTEFEKWHFIITWDNPVPADSSKMLQALRKLGRVTPVNTKTTVILSPKEGVGWRRVRKVIQKHLNYANGNAAYMNLRSRTAAHYGPKTKRKWITLN